MMPKRFLQLSHGDILRFSLLVALNLFVALLVKVLGPALPAYLVLAPLVALPIISALAFVAYRFEAWGGLALGLVLASIDVLKALSPCHPDDAICAESFYGIMIAHPVGQLTSFILAAGVIGGAARSWRRRAHGENKIE